MTTALLTYLPSARPPLAIPRTPTPDRFLLRPQLLIRNQARL
jgi:hypothetical protein